MVPGLPGEVTLLSVQAQTLRPDSLLLVATLDGSLHALSKQTGDLKWTLRDGEWGQSLVPPRSRAGAGLR